VEAKAAKVTSVPVEIAEPIIGIIGISQHQIAAIDNYHYTDNIWCNMANYKAKRAEI
jgi:hypothetical protein